MSCGAYCCIQKEDAAELQQTALQIAAAADSTAFVDRLHAEYGQFV